MLVALVFMLIVWSAVSFGIFFVIFKIGFLLFKNKRNFWPLMLAAITTLLLTILIAVASYTIYQRATKPFEPIIQAAKSIEQPIQGTNTYTDPNYGFSLTLYDGMTLSHWISFKNQRDMELLAGLDVNIFAKSSENDQVFTGLLIFHNKVQTYQDASNLLLSVMQMEKQNQNMPVKVKWSSGLIPVPVSDHITGVMVKGELISEQKMQSIPFALLVVTQDNQQYYITGFGGANAFETIKSFRLTQP